MQKTDRQNAPGAPQTHRRLWPTDGRCGGLGMPGAKVWAVGAAISWVAFRGGRRRSQTSHNLRHSPRVRARGEC
jgi:hypothetical protein